MSIPIVCSPQQVVANAGGKLGLLLITLLNPIPGAAQFESINLIPTLFERVMLS